MAAATVAISTGGGHPYPQRAGLVPVTVTLSTTPYTSTAGGFLVDISAIISKFAGTPSTTAPVPAQALAFAWADVVGAFVPQGYNDGTLGQVFAGVPSKQTTSGQFYVKAYSAGTTELTDANKTGSMVMYVVLDAGGSSYTNYV